jgi:hypothetical protein
MWLKPTGGKHDEARIASKVQVLDLHLPTALFAQLSHDYNLPTVPDRSIRYEGGVQDEVINPDWPVRVIGDDEPDRRRTHARGNVLSAARCKIGALAFGFRSRSLAD